MIVFDDMIFDMLSNNKRSPIVTEFLIRGKKQNVFLTFITQSHFAVPKNVGLNSTHYFVMKIPNKRELQQIAFNHSSDTDLQNFMNLYKNYTAKLYSLMVIDTTLASDNPTLFRENLLERIKKLIMTIDDKMKYDTNNIILTEKQQKYQQYCQIKLINMNILQVKKYYHLIKVE